MVAEKKPHCADVHGRAGVPGAAPDPQYSPAWRTKLPAGSSTPLDSPAPPSPGASSGLILEMVGFRPAAGCCNLACSKLPPSQEIKHLSWKDVIIAEFSACIVRREELRQLLGGQGAEESEDTVKAKRLLLGLFYSLGIAP